MTEQFEQQQRLARAHPLIYPHHYQADGQLKVPPVLYVILLLLARGLILLIMAAASRGQGSELMALFYPDRGEFNLAVLPGIPALALFFLLPYRHRMPVLMRRCIQPLVWISLLADFALQLHSLTLSHGKFSWSVALVLLGLFWAALSLAFSPRMKHWWKFMPMEQHEK